MDWVTLPFTTTPCWTQSVELTLAANREVSNLKMKNMQKISKYQIPGEGGKRKVSSFVLDSLPPKMRDKGVKSKKYKQVHTRIIILSPYIYIMFYRRSPFSWLWR